jgi:hypothetical protein
MPTWLTYWCERSALPDPTVGRSALPDRLLKEKDLTIAPIEISSV